MKIRDGQWELLSHDEKLGRTVWTFFDGRQRHFRTDYRVDNVLKDNHAARQDMAGQRWGEGKRVASIPLNLYYDKLAEAQAQGDHKFVAKWLNDGDNAAFRTFEGRV